MQILTYMQFRDMVNFFFLQSRQFYQRMNLGGDVINLPQEGADSMAKMIILLKEVYSKCDFFPLK